MCPDSPHTAPPIDDRTARARIRDAALELFAARGYAGASIREVAQAAGVSAGLVQHHFGTKAGLRAACDEHVWVTMEALVQRGSGGEAMDADLVSALFDASLPLMRYIVRALVDGTESGARLFDRTAGLTERWLSERWPDRFPAGSVEARTRAATMTALRLGAVVLHEHLSRWLGSDPLSSGNPYVFGSASVDVFVTLGEFFASEEGNRLREALLENERRRAPRTGGGGSGRGSEGRSI
jgi:TetR/AcrR family transcriptional regulator, regulator of cefoperazone and chloramphenicol sensitivity